jgi:hyperosmotically inducible protein
VLRVKAFTAIILFLGMLSSLWSCLTPGPRTADEVANDAAITTQVKTKLVEDPLLSRFAIGVETFRGEVTLIGAVDTVDARDKIEESATSVDGVRRVMNLIEVRQSAQETD